MRRNPYLLQGLKYATFTLLVLGGIIAGAAVFKTDSSTLTGRLIAPQERGIVPTMHFDNNRAVDGFSVPADTHVIFVVPDGEAIQRLTFFGGPDTDLLRYWGYCFSGHEQANKTDGKIGEQMYDGKFFYSLGERKAQAERPTPADNDLLGISQSINQKPGEAKASIAEMFIGGETCYVMSSSILPAAIDSDNDGVNNLRERLIGSNPSSRDSDDDGISDGTEVFVTKTNPNDPDTDHDGLWDSCEDKNQNGQVDLGETSALVSDTDRDGLCDGNGWGSGCPEKKQNTCEQNPDPTGDLICHMEINPPIYGEDMNQNCKLDKNETDPTKPETFGINDWDYKWNIFQRQTGYRVGKDAYDFPMPNLPVGY